MRTQFLKLVLVAVVMVACGTPRTPTPSRSSDPPPLETRVTAGAESVVDTRLAIDAGLAESKVSVVPATPPTTSATLESPRDTLSVGDEYACVIGIGKNVYCWGDRPKVHP